MNNSSVIELPVLDLPADEPRSTRGATNPAVLEYRGSPELSRSLDALSHRTGAAREELFLAAVFAVYAHYLSFGEVTLGARGKTLRRSFEENIRFDALAAELSTAAAAAAIDVFGSADLSFRLHRGIFIVEYDRTVYRPERIERLWEHLNAVLKAAAGDPSIEVQTIELLGQHEHALLASFAGKKAHVFWDKSVHRAVELHARSRPEAIALVDARSGATLSYRELNRAANRWARRLINAGVGPEAPVALLLERGFSLVTAILATWKAGGFYIPLDLRDPSARHQTVLEDSEPRVVVVEKRADAAGLILGDGAVLIALEEERASLKNLDSSDLGLVFEPSRLAYSIFTSGSTGRPKGALVEHRGMLNHLSAKISELGLDENTVIAQNAPHTFDISVWQQFTALAAGGRTVIFDRELVLDPVALINKVVEHHVRVLQVVPSYLSVLLDEHEHRPLHTGDLELLLTIGEALPAPTVARWFARLPNLPLMNTYGPTEASDVISHHLLRRPPSGAVPIGKPIQNTIVHIVDARGRLAPLGVPGEICVAGAGVGRGYLRRPELTRGAFIESRLPGSMGQTIYRTGDLGRWSSDGVLEYLGRLDHQVKIRGFRIELGEIEQQLLSDPRVRAAVVVARANPGEEKELCAFVVAPGLGPSDLSELKVKLRAGLPEYMVPAKFAALEAMPLTSSGKIDRRRLPELTSDEAAATPAVARTPVELAVLEIWESVLGRKNIPADKDFFSLGGTSLSAIKVSSKIRRRFGVEYSVRDFFAAPTVLASAATVAGKAPAEQPANSAPEEREYPLSSAQRQFWFLHQLDGSAAQYNMPFAFELRGEFDIDAFRTAIAAVIARHANFRTVFLETEQGPVQHVEDHSPEVFEYLDLRAYGPAEARRRALALADAEALHVFDLRRGPLVRIKGVQLAENDAMVLANMHHVIGDGWSLALFVDEVARNYLRLREGGSIEHRPAPNFYAAYSRRQSELLAGEPGAALRAFWKLELGDAPQMIELPTDHPRPRELSAAGGLHVFQLAKSTVTALKQLNETHGVTTYMTLAAAFAALLNRYSGQEDLVFGSPFANRESDELEETMGNFVHTLPLRVSVDDGRSFAELLGLVKERTLRVLAHQALPFEEIVRELAPERTLNRNPIFHTLFSFQNFPVPEVEVPGLTIEPIEARHQTSKFDFTLSLGETEAGLEGSVEYSTDLYSAAFIERLAEHFQNLLAAALEEPTRPLRALPMLSAEEQAGLLWLGQTTKHTARSVPELFEEAAAADPGAIALRAASGVVTYGALNAAANRLARYLTTRAPGAERIGVYLAPSPELVISFLAILKMGAAYIPLDPKNPPARLRQILDDAEPALVITCAKYRDAIEARPRVDLDEIELYDYSAENLRPPLRLDGETPAYLMYTSGSTGAPKAVMIPHRGIVRLVKNTNYLEFSSKQTFFMLAPTSFDASTLEIWGSLLNGASLVIPETERPSVAEIAATVEKEKIDVLWLTTGLFNLMVDEKLSSLRGVKYLLTGGDVASPSHVQRALAALDETILINGYGPTENTTFSTCYTIPRTYRSEERLPIGSPITGTDVYVLDAEQNLVPRGVIGELWVGGDGVGLGYWKNPALSAEKFIDDRFTGRGLLYRTGDRARFSPAGQLEFYGRGDAQVKIRGYRIELGEIESALAEHPAVKNASVRAWPKKEGAGKLLAAHVVTGTNVSAEELRAYLKTKLPDYMVPAAIELLDQLPLNVNGKVDKHRLPEPAFGARAQRALKTPESDEERALCEVWAKLLNLAAIGADENVHQLGADSITALQAAIALHKLGWSAEPSALLKEESIAGAAKYLSRLSSVGATTEKRGSARLPLTPSQSAMLVHSLVSGEPELYCQHLSFTLSGPLDVERMRRAARALVERHKALRAVFMLREDGAHEQSFLPEVEVAFWVEDISGLSAERQAKHRAFLVESDRRRGFDLFKGPLFFFRLLREGGDRHRLMLVHHHILFDGWSVSILFEDLLRAYSEQTFPAPAAELDLYMRWSEGIDEAALEQFWRRELSGFTDPTSMPAAKNGENRGKFLHRERELRLDGEESAAIIRFAKLHQLTPATVLQGAFAYLLSRYSGQDDVVFGVTLAGRPASCPRAGELVGLLVNTVPFRVRLGAATEVVAWLRRLQENMVEVRRHETVGREQLRHWSAVGGSGAFKLFNSVFVFENFPELKNPARELRHGPLEFTVPAHSTVFYVVPDTHGFKLHLDYDGFGCSEAEATALLETFRHVALSIVSKNEQRLADLHPAPEKERTHLLALSAAAEAAGPHARATVYELFAAAAARAPESLALVFGEEYLSYGALLLRAENIAAELVSKGVGRGDRAAIALERSTELIAALLAVTKLGATFVPIDPRAPAERRKSLALDADVRFVLSEESPIHEDRVDTVSLEHCADHPAYIIYTSGSTGDPKGVAVRHDSLAGYTESAIAQYHLVPSDRVLQFAALTFDACLEEIFPTLAAGATLVLRDERALESFAGFIRLVEEQQISVLNLPTAFWKSWMAEAELIPAGVRLLIIGGEAAPRTAAATWLELAQPEQKLVNTYGPTEATIVATTFELTAATLETAPPILPIGRPVRNARVSVRDSWGGELPRGIPGELWIGGPGVAAGYFGRPEATAERFLPGGWYRTGDRAMWLEDGNLHYLGRFDEQLKVNGFRIEPGEIESALCAHPNVRAAAVKLFERPEAMLVAYVEEKQSADGATDYLEFLRARLPGFMLPRIVEVLARLPRTASGKLDKRLLPLPEARAPKSRASGLAANRVEDLVASVFADCFQKSLSLDDNFFERGGNSILATTAISRLRKVLGEEIPVKWLFEAPTARALSRRILAQQTAPETQLSAVPLKTSRHGPLLAIVPGIFGAVSYLSALAQALPPSRGVIAFRAPGLDGAASPESIELLAERYCAELCTRQPEGPYYLAGHSFGAGVAFAMARRLAAEGRTVARLFVLDGHAPVASAEEALSEEILLAEFYVALTQFLGGELEAPAEASLPAIAASLQRAGLVTGDLDVETLERYFSVFKTNICAAPPLLSPALKIPATIVRAADSPENTADGWRTLFSGELEILSSGGDHFSMLEPPHAELLAAKLEAQMARAHK